MGLFPRRGRLVVGSWVSFCFFYSTLVFFFLGGYLRDCHKLAGIKMATNDEVSSHAGMTTFNLVGLFFLKKCLTALAANLLLDVVGENEIGERVANLELRWYVPGVQPIAFDKCQQQKTNAVLLGLSISYVGSNERERKKSECFKYEATCWAKRSFLNARRGERVTGRRPPVWTLPQGT